MSQEYKLKFDEMRESDPTEKEAEHESFATLGHVRNLCFVWPDGKKKFRNYAYLIGADINPDGGILTLNFTSDTFVIKGSGLDELFEELLGHVPKRIVCINPRHSIISDQGITINEIVILGKPL